MNVTRTRDDALARSIMALKKKKKSGGGEVPEWVVTFGDMMSLLLCFFILLQMFSELKKDREYQRVVTAIKEAFGYSGSIGVLPVNDLPLRSMVELLENMAVQNNHDKTKISQNQDPGLDGPHVRVTRVREGIVFTIGGPATFAPLSAEVEAPMRKELEKIAVLLAGRRNRIEVVGHAASKHLPDGSGWSSLDDLSSERAENVKNVLVQLGIDDDCFRLVSVGMREPYRPDASGPVDAAENRRVEVILTEVLTEEVPEPGLAGLSGE